MTEQIKLPELPPGTADGFMRSLFTAAQMTAYATAAVLAERERCAKLCDENSFREVNGEVVLTKHRGPLNHDGQRYAAAIRAQAK